MFSDIFFCYLHIVTAVIILFGLYINKVYQSAASVLPFVWVF